jgi:hypothetical protein
LQKLKIISLGNLFFQIKRQELAGAVQLGFRFIRWPLMDKHWERGRQAEEAHGQQEEEEQFPLGSSKGEGKSSWIINI